MKKLLFTLLLISSFANAQNTINLFGKVLDENERPISGATISIQDFLKIIEIMPFQLQMAFH